MDLFSLACLAASNMKSSAVRFGSSRTGTLQLRYLDGVVSGSGERSALSLSVSRGGTRSASGADLGKNFGIGREDGAGGCMKGRPCICSAVLHLRGGHTGVVRGVSVSTGVSIVLMSAVVVTVVSGR